MSAQLINQNINTTLPPFNTQQLNDDIENSTFNNANTLKTNNTRKVTILDLPTLYDIPKNWIFGNSSINRVDKELDQESMIKTTKIDRVVKKRKILKLENKALNNNSFFQHSTTKDIDIRNETIYVFHHRWVPIHAVTNYSGLWWSHFLVAMDDLSLLRCKHCDTILTITAKDSIDVNLISHLRTCHSIDSSVDFYSKKLHLTLYQNSNSLTEVTDHPIGIYITPCPSVYSKRNLITDPFGDQENEQQEKKEIEEAILYGSFMTSSLSSDILLTIMMITQNISLSFTQNPLFSSLIECVSRNVSIKNIDIKDNIVNISEEIENLLRNTISNNFPIHFNKNNSSNETINGFQQLKDTFEKDLVSIKNAAIFSLGYHIWSNKYFVITATYFDMLSQTQKTVPLSVTQIDITKERIDELFVSQKFQEVYNRYPGLSSSTLTITLPNEHMIRRVKEDSINFFPSYVTNVSYNQLRICVLTSLCSAIENLFGSYLSVEENSDSVIGSDPIDILINLKNIDISASIFGKINSFYSEILNDPVQAYRFVDICYELEMRVPNIKLFDSKKPSIAIEFLTQFEKIIDVVLEMEPFLKNEKFTDSDFKVIKLLINFLESAYSIINHLLGDSMYLPIFSLVLLHQFEKQLNNIINEVRYSRFMHGFNRCLNRIIETRKFLEEVDSSKLASFFIPYILMNNQMQKRIFHTRETSEIVSICSSIGFSLLHKFININQPEEEPAKKSINYKESGELLFKGLPFTFVKLNDESNKVSTMIDEVTPIISSVKDLLSHEIESDLNHYLMSVSSEYQELHDSYIAMRKYEFTGKSYKNKDTNDTLTALQELEFIHLPICREFLSKYLSCDIGLLFMILLKFVCTENVSSIRNEYLYLSNYTPNIDDDFIESCLKIKIFNEQFNMNRDDLGNITLGQLCKYNQ